MARRLGDIIEHFELDRPVIVAMDMGGQPALVFAAQHPDRVDRLVVMNSLVFGDERTSREIRWLRKFGFNRFALRNLAWIVFRRAETLRASPIRVWTSYPAPRIGWSCNALTTSSSRFRGFLRGCPGSAIAVFGFSEWDAVVGASRGSSRGESSPRCFQ
jgi:pimeloyl-ACP methyl ester carboxylesterase